MPVVGLPLGPRERSIEDVTLSVPAKSLRLEADGAEAVKDWCSREIKAGIGAKILLRCLDFPAESQTQYVLPHETQTSAPIPFKQQQWPDLPCKPILNPSSSS